jgi:hypothetical protein
MKQTTLVGAAVVTLFAGLALADTTELVIYKGDHFRGPAQTIKGEVANLENGFGHEASSMVVRGGAWQVCTGDHFSGRCKVVESGEYPTLGWLNDRIVSVKFLGNDPNRTRYDNWDAKRTAQDDWRDRRDDARDYRPRSEANDSNYYGRSEWRGRSDRGDDQGYQRR